MLRNDRSGAQNSHPRSASQRSVRRR